MKVTSWRKRVAGISLAGGLISGAAIATADTTPATTALTRVAAPYAVPSAVTVARAGTRFSPPVPASSIPEGAWMCNMGGKVHYAALERGDGKCPVCKMKLVQKGGASERQHDSCGGDEADSLHAHQD